MERLTMVEALESIAEQIRSGDLDTADSALDALEPTDDTREEMMFLRAYLHEQRFEREEALTAYEALLEENPDHAEAAFRAAVICDQGGDDDAAVELYRQCIERTPAHVNALLNLAFMYEERGSLPDAEALLKSVLAERPNHVRAQQFLKSVENSYTMAYDERFLREREGRDATLDVPVSDFELSVRSRNCLKQMNIRTLGDLLRITEPELLSYRNFGETSLNEIRAMLVQKGLRLGQEVQPAEQPVALQPTPALDDTAANLRRPIAEMELSVRSRKCLQRLGVVTLGELASRSEAELTALKNFGQTSLTEIKQQLAVFGLSLRSTESPIFPNRLPPVPVPGFSPVFPWGPATVPAAESPLGSPMEPVEGAQLGDSVEPVAEPGEPTAAIPSPWPVVEAQLGSPVEPAAVETLPGSTMEPVSEASEPTDVIPSPEPAAETGPEPDPKPEPITTQEVTEDTES